MALREIFDQRQSDTLGVYWYDRLIGSLVHQGEEIVWAGQSPQYSKIFGVKDETEEPAVVKNLEPEGWLSDVLGYVHQWPYLEEGLCFLSNLRIVAPHHKQVFLELSPRDVLRGRLEAFTRADGVFTGDYQGPCPDGLNAEMARSVAAYWENKEMPRLSGAQMKLPMCLHEDGRLVPPLGRENTFTHLLKLPGPRKAEIVGALEWFCLEVSQRVGIKTAKHALLPLPGGLPPALLVERFDIPESKECTRKILMQDFCSLGKIPSDDKDKGSIEQCAKLLKSVSLDWEADRLALFDRVVISYALRDGDMHRKNLSILKSIEGCDPDTLKIEMSPAYDIVNTLVFHSKDKMILPLNGKKDSMDRKTWEYFGKFLGMDPQDSADRAMRIIGDAAKASVEIMHDLPPEISVHPQCLHGLKRATTETVELARKNGLQTPDWEPVHDSKEKLGKDDAKQAKRKLVRYKLGFDEVEVGPYDIPLPRF